MIAKVLVALDTSPRAAPVFDAAVEIAERFGATLYPLRVVTVPPEFPPAAHTSGDPLPTRMVADAREDLAHLASRAPEAKLAPPTIVAAASAWRAILDSARQLDVDLIVIGSHGFHGWDRILGTTAARVANVADRNVFVVHPR